MIKTKILECEIRKYKDHVGIEVFFVAWNYDFAAKTTNYSKRVADESKHNSTGITEALNGLKQFVVKNHDSRTGPNARIEFEIERDGRFGANLTAFVVDEMDGGDSK